MDPFTQKLLQRTQARKEALAKKRQESQSAITREPLVLKDDNIKLSRGKEGETGHPVAKPRTDNSKESNASGRLKSSNSLSPGKDEKKERYGSKRESLEGLDDNVKEKKARFQSKGNVKAYGTNTTKPVNSGETLQQRLDRLRSQKRRGEDDAAELKKQRLLEIETQQNLRANLYGKSNKSNARNDVWPDEIRRRSMSIEDKAAIFEAKPIRRGSSTTRSDTTSSEQTADTPNRERKNDGKHVKTYARYADVNNDEKKGVNGKRQNEYDRYSMEVDSNDASEDDYSEGKESCDDNPFDISDILREADKAEKREYILTDTVEDEGTKNKTNVFEATSINLDKESDDCEVMNIQYDNGKVEEVEEEASEFQKLLAQKQKQLKSPMQQRKLHNIINNLDEYKYVTEESDNLDLNNQYKYVEETDIDHVEDNENVEDSDKETSARHFDKKEDRVNTERDTTEDRETETPNKKQLRIGESDIQTFKKTKSHAPEPLSDASDTNKIFSPNSQTYKSTRTKSKSKSKTNLRRSISFTKGTESSEKAVYSSGYNETQSSKYNVVTNVKVQQEHTSNRETIQEFLELAASQQNIVLQTSQALNVCLNGGEDRRGNPEVIEGERFLLLATERRTACLDEVQRLKQQPKRNTYDFIGAGVESPPPPYRQACNANIAISEIRIPLHNDFLFALRGGKVDLGVFHFIVHVQYGPTQIQSTHVMSTHDELSGNTLCYKSHLELRDVPHDFVVNVKVFGMHTKRGDLTNRNRRQSIKQTKESPGIMKNIRRRINSDASPGHSESPQKTVFRNSSFILVGESKLNFALIRAGKHVLTKVPSNCPLEGFIQFHADVIPQFSASASGFLTLFEDVGGYTTWNRRWCVMEGNTISYWRYPDDETKPPIGTVELKDCINHYVTLVPRDECSRPNTFELKLKRPVTRDDKPSLLATVEGGKITIKLWISADNKEDRMSWLETLNCQLSDDKAWSIKPLGTKLGSMHNKDVYMCSQGRGRAVAV